MLAGAGADLLDIVIRLHGLGTFAEEIKLGETARQEKTQRHVTKQWLHFPARPTCHLECANSRDPMCRFYF